METKTRLFIFGKSGRMGQELCSVLQDHPAALCIGGRTSLGDEGHTSDADVFIDFSVPAALPYVLEIALALKKPLVIGTTALTSDQLDQIEKASKSIPIIQASNTSLGIAVLSKISEQVASMLDETFDIEISETHHRNKVDSPSGTALSLAEAAAQGRGLNFDRTQVSMDRSGERGQGIGFSVRRGGGVVGDHTVAFMSADEMIELTHRGLSRRLFAQGAVKAALLLKTRHPGLYSMAQILGI